MINKSNKKIYEQQYIMIYNLYNDKILLIIQVMRGVNYDNQKLNTHSKKFIYNKFILSHLQPNEYDELCFLIKK